MVFVCSAHFDLIYLLYIKVGVLIKGKETSINTDDVEQMRKQFLLNERQKQLYIILYSQEFKERFVTKAPPPKRSMTGGV